MSEFERERTKKLIVRSVKRYLRNAREKEQLYLTGSADAFCRTHDLRPEEIELVKREYEGETTFFFRRRQDAVIFPTKEDVN